MQDDIFLMMMVKDKTEKTETKQYNKIQLFSFIRPDMTIAVDWEVKHQSKQTNHSYL